MSAQLASTSGRRSQGEVIEPSVRCKDGDLPGGDEIARRINERPRPAQVSRQATLTLVDRDGRRRERELLVFWKDRPDARWLVFFALAPPDLEHEAFLAHDHFDARTTSGTTGLRASGRTACPRCRAASRSWAASSRSRT